MGWPWISAHWPSFSREELEHSLSPSEGVVFQALQTVPSHPQKCATSLVDVFRSLASGDYQGISDQLQACASCGDYKLNFLSAKIIDTAQRNQKVYWSNAEYAAVNNFSLLFEPYLTSKVPFRTRVRVYHELHGSWAFPIYFAAIGGSAGLFRHHQKKLHQFFTPRKVGKE